MRLHGALKQATAPGAFCPATGDAVRGQRNALRQAVFCMASEIRGRENFAEAGFAAAACAKGGTERFVRAGRKTGKGGMEEPKRRRSESKIPILQIPPAQPGNKSSELLLYSPAFSYQQKT
jgi:hypothetical protein